MKSERNVLSGRALKILVKPWAFTLNEMRSQWGAFDREEIS